MAERIGRTYSGPLLYKDLARKHPQLDRARESVVLALCSLDDSPLKLNIPAPGGITLESRMMEYIEASLASSLAHLEAETRDQLVDWTIVTEKRLLSDRRIESEETRRYLMASAESAVLFGQALVCQESLDGYGVDFQALVREFYRYSNNQNKGIRPVGENMRFLKSIITNRDIANISGDPSLPIAA